MINVSKNKCVGCGVCVNECPVGAINIKEGVAFIDKQKCINCGLCIQNCSQGAIKEIKERLLFAIGTDDKINIKNNDHVGASLYYSIWEYNKGSFNFLEDRRNIKYNENESQKHGDPAKSKIISNILDGVDVIVGAIFGPNIVRMKNKFVCAVVRESKIEKAIKIIQENINEIIEEKNSLDKKGIILF